MSNPKSQKETISLIEDLQRAPGYVEWFVPTVERLIARLESEICDEGTSPEETTRKKIERTVWLSVLRLPDEMLSGCKTNLQAFVDGVRGKLPDA